MHIYDLIGKVAIRTTNTVRGSDRFQYNPVLILACEGNKAMICTLEEGDGYSAGETVCLAADYLDNAWQEFGVLINSAVQTKAQIVAKMLMIMGIQADKESIQQLCLAVTYKDLFNTIEDQLELKDIINALRSSDNEITQETLADNAQPPEVNDNNTWNGLAGHKSFVKRGIF